MFHSPHIHQVFERFIRSNHSGENEPVSIFSIICFRAKAEGRPYTKRILPHFIIPECNITLDNSLEVLKEFPDGKLNLDRASLILGTVCDATIKKHYHLVQQMTEYSNLELAAQLSHLPSLARLSQDLPDENDFTLLNKYIQIYQDALVRMGESGSDFRVIIFLFRTYYIIKARNEVHFPMDYISQYHFFFDTG